MSCLLQLHEHTERKILDIYIEIPFKGSLAIRDLGKSLGSDLWLIVS